MFARGKRKGKLHTFSFLIPEFSQDLTVYSKL